MEIAAAPFPLAQQEKNDGGRRLSLLPASGEKVPDRADEGQFSPDQKILANSSTFEAS